MAYRNYSNRRGYRRSRGAYSHVSQASAFSRSVGGTDADVKDYFFHLSHADLNAVMRAYGHSYGASAESYARKSYVKWQTGETKMSGMVAERLFEVLPQFLNISVKLGLVKSLWKHTQPTSHKSITVTKENSAEEIHTLVTQHFKEVISPHNIPEHFLRRFDWLAGNDSTVKQQLENYFVEMQRDLQNYSSKPIIESFLNKLQSENINFSGNHEIKVGGHTLGIKFQNPHVPDIWEQYGCFIIIAVIILFLIIVNL
jgi:hypothetical protein